MTLRQEAYKEIDKLSDEDVRLVIRIMKKMRPEKEDDSFQKKAKFLASAGSIEVNEDAVNELRKESMI